MESVKTKRFPFVSGFYKPENEAWVELLDRWAQLVNHYSNRVEFCPPGEPSHERVPDASFWHGENTCTALLQAAAWSLNQRNDDAGWAAATEVWCRRAYEDGDSAGRLDLYLQSPRGTSYLVEAKHHYCKDGKVEWDVVRAKWKQAHEQLHHADQYGYPDPWCLGVLFLVPYSESDSESCWKRFEDKLWDNRPHLAATAKISEPAVWDGAEHPGIALVGSAMKWSDYKK